MRKKEIGQIWIIYGKLWREYCPECQKRTTHRYLDCEEHGKDCELTICCECGSNHKLYPNK